MGPFDWCRWLRNDTQKGHYIEGETPRSPPTILLVSQFPGPQARGSQTEQGHKGERWWSHSQAGKESLYHREVQSPETDSIWTIGVTS